jgi:hypothetical protein
MSDASAVQYSLIVAPPLGNAECAPPGWFSGLGEECDGWLWRFQGFLGKVREAMVI